MSCSISAVWPKQPLAARSGEERRGAAVGRRSPLSPKSSGSKKGNSPGSRILGRLYEDRFRITGASGAPLLLSADATHLYPYIDAKASRCYLGLGQ